MDDIDLSDARRRAAAAAARWQLELGEAFSLSRYSFVAAVGDDAVIKVRWEGDDESRHEPEALALWGAGGGSVRLLRHDREHDALLEERAVPGTDLSTLPEDESLAVAVEIAQKLWRHAGAPFRWVGDQMPAWLANNPSSLTPLAWELWETLDPGREWLVHGDFHHHNILRHGGGYVAIDPKPYLADREYDVYSFLTNPLSYVIQRDDAERRIAAFVAAGLDDYRIRAWSIIRAAQLTTDPHALAVFGSLLD
jgi:streptomycin 6-kinase